MNIPRFRAAACAAALVLLVCGCTTLPDSGAVHTAPDRADATGNQAAYFDPPGPSKDATPTEIVHGFLRAMRANPPSIKVARGFLSSRARVLWKPTEGTIVYDAATVDGAGDHVTARLRGARRLSPNGAWLDGTDANTTTVPLALVQEGGQWRIDNPPNVLAVPESYFSSLFVGFNLYFFDRSGTVLVPSKVYVPRGEKTATNLVRGLLAGPPPGVRGVAVSAFPVGLDLDLLAVVVSATGIAEVPLEAEALDVSPAELHRMVIQLAWTLRQVPGITRLQLTVDGAPVPLAGNATDISVNEGAEYDPLAVPVRALVALSDGIVVRDDGDELSPVAGPFGQEGFALRSLAWSAGDHLIAGVSANGRRVFVAPDRGARSASRVRTVLDGGTNLLRPVYDRFGSLWVVDATSKGAVVHVVSGRRDRVVQVDGISNRPVTAFTVTRDGASLVAMLGSGTNPVVEVSNIVRIAGGRVERVSSARTLVIGGADLGPAADVAQNGATTVAILSRPTAGPDQITYVELDGSPVTRIPPGIGPPDSVPGDLVELIASPDPALPLRVVTADDRLLRYAGGDLWNRDPLSAVTAATYAQ
jgi:hypothetical protein